MAKNDYNRFKDLGFGGFKNLARDSSLSKYEKIGFPNSYREGHEDNIFNDITTKLPNLRGNGRLVLDIGPGCSDLATMLIRLCGENSHKLFLADSAEMLGHLPDEPFITKLPGRFPEDFGRFIDEYAGRLDVILTYSVSHYIFAESNIFNFLDSMLMLLSHGGELLIGDIPNISKRNRFFSSPAGIEYHKNFMATDKAPSAEFNRPMPGSIDDTVLFSILARSRASGYDAYLVPQAEDLPMSNRREDILVRRP